MKKEKIYSFLDYFFIYSSGEVVPLLVENELCKKGQTPSPNERAFIIKSKD